MNVFVFVVSHAHGKLLNSIDTLSHLNNDGLLKVYIKNNIIDCELLTYTEKNRIPVFNEAYGLGFGGNNNYIYKKLKHAGGITNQDYIVILNPDIAVEVSVLKDLVFQMQHDDIQIASINLFRDKNFIFYDNSVRNFPTLKDFIFSYVMNKNRTIIDKSKISEPLQIDWAAGSFIAIRADLYEDLKGFDEGYFMYCEDIDLCYRAHMLGKTMMYYPQYKAIHYAAHANRKIFSRHFCWHCKSIARFLLKKFQCQLLKKSKK